MGNLGHTVATLRAARPRHGEAAADARLRELRGFGSNPGQLVMKAYAPADVRPGAALVVVLHGCTQTADSYAAPAGWLDLADRFDFVLVAPEQRRENNPNLCFNWYQSGDAQRGGGEAESIAQMVAHALRTHDLDGGRVFITGLSAGGAMASVMLAAYPELFSGGAIVAGLPYGVATSVSQAFETMSMSSTPSAQDMGDLVRRATNHTGPWPKVSVWHGQSDSIVRPAAGEAVAAQWRDVHGVKGPSRTARTPDGRDFQVWLSPQGDPVVELHRIPGLGHGAPVMAAGANGCGRSSQYTPEIGLSSSFEIALGWGIVTRDAAFVGQAERSSPKGKARGEPPRRQQGQSPLVATVINDALRAAGLLR